MLNNFQKFLPALILLITCFGLYAQNLSTDYFLDDHLLKTQTRLQDINQIPTYFAHPSMGDHRFRPLSDMVRTGLFQWFGFSVVKYRFFNLGAFYLLSLLVYFLIRRLTADQFLSLLTSILFSIHAINTTLVQYVWNLDTILATICLIFSALTALDYFYTQSWKDCVKSLIMYILAILFAESSTIFPLFLILFTFYIEKNRKELKVYLKQISPYIIIALAYFLFRQKVANFTGSAFMYSESLNLSVSEYVASIASLIWWYVSKFFLPTDILIIWNIKPVVDVSTFGSFFFLLIVMFLVWKVVFVWKKRIVSMGLMWFLSGFLPLTVGMFIMPFLGLVLEPHWFVFSSIGGFLLISWGIFRLKELLPTKVFAVIITCFLAFHAIMTTAYNQKWESEETYCLYWSKIKPNNYFAAITLANRYFHDKDYTAAKKYLLQAVMGPPNPYDWMTYTNLGYIAYLEGNFSQALSYYQKAQKLNPQAKIIQANMDLLKNR